MFHSLPVWVEDRCRYRSLTYTRFNQEKHLCIVGYSCSGRLVWWDFPSVQLHATFWWNQHVLFRQSAVLNAAWVFYPAVFVWCRLFTTLWRVSHFSQLVSVLRSDFQSFCFSLLQTENVLVLFWWCNSVKHGSLYPVIQTFVASSRIRLQRHASKKLYQ